jgi:hypothetical protein
MVGGHQGSEVLVESPQGRSSQKPFKTITTSFHGLRFYSSLCVTPKATWRVCRIRQVYTDGFVPGGKRTMLTIWRSDGEVEMQGCD